MLYEALEARIRRLARMFVYNHGSVSVADLRHYIPEKITRSALRAFLDIEPGQDRHGFGDDIVEIPDSYLRHVCWLVGYDLR